MNLDQTFAFQSGQFLAWNAIASASATNSQVLSTPPSHFPEMPWRSPSHASAGTNLVFIDAAVGDPQSLMAGWQPGTEVYVLDPAQDAIAQITQTLLGRTNVTSLHILSHGTAGGLQLGQNWLNQNTLNGYASQLQSWSTALIDDADILLYGCNVAFGDIGTAFLHQLAQITGADIAASHDLTGNAALGGDWDLEVAIGQIETSSFMANAYDSVLADFTAANFAELQTAINSANTQPGDDTITFTGNITLANLLPVISSNIAFNGGGNTISGGGSFQVFFVNSGTVSFSNMAIANGRASGGNGGNALLMSGAGGGAAGMGGGLFVNSGTVTLANVTFTGNLAQGGNGGTSTNATGGSGGGGGVGGAGTNGGNGTAGNGGSGGNFGTAGGGGNTGNGASGSVGSGGGGGGGNGLVNTTSNGGNGGFGGGGGGGVAAGGAGGFGGGGGGASLSQTAAGGGSFGGAGGIGSAANQIGGGGGGGAGLGGAIFVRNGSLTMTNTLFTNNTATGGNGGDSAGAGDTPGTNGQGKGGAIFVNNGATVSGTGVVFNGNTAANGSNSGTDNGNVFGNVTVTNANPIVTLPGAAPSYTENAAPVLLDSTATVSDFDSADLNTGTLTVNVTAGGTAGDRLAIRHQGNNGGQIGLDGRIINFGGTRIGTFTGGIGTESLVITFDRAAATPAAIQALLRNLTYTSVADNLPSNGNRTVSVVLTDGDGGTSAIATKAITVNGVNDAPAIAIPRVLYDGSTNQSPTQAGAAPNGPWFSYGDATQVLGGNANATTNNGGTVLTTDATAYAGFSNYTANPIFGFPITFTSSLLNPNFPTLNRNTGFVFSFTSQLISESRTPTANKNNDGRDDRAGFSVIVISDDLQGIELGFWTDRIWAQEDGTTQSNQSLEPDSPPFSNFRTLFTQAEFNSNVDTTALINYDLSILGNSYTLFGNGNPLLSGRLRNYSAFNPPTFVTPPGIPGVLPGVPVILPDPYAQRNFIFMGDSTPSAQAEVRLNAMSVTTGLLSNNLLPALTVNEDTAIALPGNILLTDIDAGATAASVSLAAPNGFVTVNGTVPGGVTAGNVTNNSTGNVTITAPLPQILATLWANGITYQGNLNFSGNDTLTLTLNDNGATGGTAQSVAANIAITVNPVNDRPTFTASNPTPISINSGEQTITNWATFSPGPANESAQMVTGYSVTNLSNAALFTVAPTINANGTLSYTPAANVTGSATFQVTVQDNGGTANGGINTSLAQEFTITVNPANAGNSAPTLDSSGTPSLNSLVRGDVNSVGITITELIGRLGGTGITDTDVNALRGIAITAVDNSNGTWQYSTNGGNTWDLFNTPSNTAARLLASDANTRLRFVPNLTFVGTVANGITFRAWDQTTGSNGNTVDTSSNGGTTAFSSATETAGITVTQQRSTNGSDFNGDGRADPVWRNTQSGDSTIWQTNNFTFANFSLLQAIEPAWSIAGTGDFDGDGDDEILWRNSSTGQNSIWQLNNFTFSTFHLISPVDLSWQVAGIADFDGDGDDEIFWRQPGSGINSIWRLNNFTLSTFNVITSVDASWRVAGLGDFNGDGRSEILWRQLGSGINSIWRLNNFTLSTFNLINSVETSWDVAGIADFDGDGRSEILWRQPGSGINSIWRLNNFTLSTFNLINSVEASWRVAGLGDFDGDGQSEIFWRNNGEGINTIWKLNSFTFSTFYRLPDVTGNEWVVRL